MAGELIKANQRRDLQTLTAPVNGVVQQLAAHTVGASSHRRRSWMVVVPANSQLEIEAMVPNKDNGFVRAGQEAEIKVDTFNFTKYGLLHARVTTISQDSVTRAKPDTNRGQSKSGGDQGASSEPAGEELVYTARVALDRARIDVDGELVNLAPGMALTTEIKTGSRRITEYLLAPVLRHRQESLRER